MIDLHMGRLLAEMTRLMWLDGITKVSELTEAIKQLNPLKIKDELINKHGFYEYKIKEFLLALATGMRPAKLYNGIESAICGFLLSDDPATKMNGESFIPSSKLFLPVDANQVIKSGTLAPERAGEIVPQIDVELKRRITKSEIMILEMLKTNNWKRPVYFAVTVGDDYYLGLNDHFELTGLAYQILPIGAKGAGSGVNTKEMYDNMINKFRYGNIQDPKVYLDENTLRMCRTHRMMFSQLASALYNEGDSVKALKTLDFAAKMIPGNTVAPLLVHV
jgi:hypothetical protein